MSETNAFVNDNSRVIDAWVADGWTWGTPISHEAYERAIAGELELVLTPNKVVPRSWYPESLAGLDVLCLASGGGQQGPVFQAHGARVTVLDNSAAQLEAERVVAEREGYNIALVKADMTQALPFADASFDLVFHPVSNCYIEDVCHVWREVARVLRPGGRLLAGFDTCINYMVDDAEERIVNRMPFNPFRNTDQREGWDVDEWGWQFSHTLEEQIAGQLRAGLRLVDLYDDTHSEGRLAELNIPAFCATLAVLEG